MAIIRVQKNENYTTINNTALKDTRLSFKAKGLMAYMLSVPDDWKFYQSELTNRAADGVSSIRSGLKELEKYGYLVRYQDRDSKTGEFAEIIWDLYEVPLSEKRISVNPLSEELKSENETLLSTKELSTEELSTDNKDILSSSDEPDSTPYKAVVDYLNEKTGSKYRSSTQATQRLIKARFNEGFDLQDFKQVIDNKTNDWLNDKKMAEYLRPQTLFGTKFESYLNQITANRGGGYDTSEYDDLF